MTIKSEHIRFCKQNKTFHPSCSHGIFSFEEWDALTRYGHWFKALEEGILQAFTPEQVHFVQAAKGEVKPETFHEQLWFKYKKRKEIEAKYGAAMHKVPRAEKDQFHNREGAKKLKSMQKNFGNPAGKKKLK